MTTLTLSSSTRYTGYTWPPYAVTLQDEAGQAINLTGVDTSALQMVLKDASTDNGTETAGAGTWEIPSGTATQGKALYHFASADLATPGLYYLCVSLQTSAGNGPEAFAPEMIEVKPFPAYVGGSTPPPPTSSVPAIMPVISRGVPAYTNDDFSGAFPASNANNLLYGNYWRTVTAPTGNADSGTLTQAVYLAYDLSSVPSAQRGQVVAAWYNDPATGIYNPSLVSQTYNNVPRDYTIEVNAAAGGSLPSSGWVTLATVTNNLYHSRQHALDLTGYNWIRINISAINGSIANNNAQLNFDIHDAHLANEDNWIFFGDSITQRGLDHSDTILPSLINTVQATRWPLMECGGIGGDLSTTRVIELNTWLPLFSGKYVGLLYGTNDANNAGPGDPNFGPAFTTAMTTMIQAIIAAGKVPVLPISIPWGKTANIQANGPTINTRIATLMTTFPQIVHGPDLWAYFQANPSLINDNDVHPTTDGYVAYRQQWADVLIANVYTS
jgi:lysophospholipase L1-like esterase